MGFPALCTRYVFCSRLDLPLTQVRRVELELPYGRLEGSRESFEASHSQIGSVTYSFGLTMLDKFQMIGVSHGKNLIWGALVLTEIQETSIARQTTEPLVQPAESQTAPRLGSLGPNLVRGKPKRAYLSVLTTVLSQRKVNNHKLRKAVLNMHTRFSAIYFRVVTNQWLSIPFSLRLGFVWRLGAWLKISARTATGR